MPSVVRKYPEVPAVCGQLTPSSTRLPVPFGVRFKLPLGLVVIILLPLNVKLSTFNTSNLLSPSTMRALLAVTVPAA